MGVQGIIISTASKTADGFHVSPLGDHIIRQENTTRETNQAVERRPGQILEGQDLAEDITRQADGMLRPSSNHGTLYGCPMVMMNGEIVSWKWP